jgi:beta-galactosidase/beta-glucuronidase
VLLHLGAVDWHARVLIDGAFVGEHFGGSTAFALDVTDHLPVGRPHTLVVEVRDRLRGREQPAGKQSAKPWSYGCYYTRTTGIWQPVWLEAVGESWLADVAIVPDLAGGRLLLTPTLARPRGPLRLRVEVRDGARVVGEAEAAAQPGVPLAVPLRDPVPWSPERPQLYDLRLLLLGPGDAVRDEVHSYAGLRSVRVDGGRFLLNGEPRFQRLVLDQGFYPGGVWTAPDDAALKRDIELAMAMGFNGARLHQKVFEPRFHYWADRLGYLTWGESPSWGFDVDSLAGARNFLLEWSAIVSQCRNHPSIVAWSPLNESGHRQGRLPEPISEAHRRLVQDAAALTRRLDPTRPVNDSSGWVHQDTDLWTAHSYEQDPTKLAALLAPFPDVLRNAPANEPGYAGQPFILAEFGGAAWTEPASTAELPAARDATTTREANEIATVWGYGQPPRSREEFHARVRAQVDAALATPHLRGFCYTQLTDVEQEQNGLLTYDREPKLGVADYRAIFAREPGR